MIQCEKKTEVEMKGNNCFYEIERKDGLVRVRLVGEIDHHNAVALRTELDAFIGEERPQKLALDLSGIGFMDSSGLGFVMGRYALMQRYGGELVLESPGERTMKIFELAGISRMIKIECEKKEEIQ